MSFTCQYVHTLPIMTVNYEDINIIWQSRIPRGNILHSTN